LRVIKRLLSQAVARGKESTPWGVPNREREHSAKMLHAFDAIFLVKMDEDFGVGGRPECMSARLKLVAKVTKVINLTVKRDPDRSIFIRQRRNAPGVQIDDGKPPLPETDAGRRVDALCVWPAMNKGFAHLADETLGDDSTGEIDFAANAAHGSNRGRVRLREGLSSAVSRRTSF
jgi:hypothetical protein